MDEPLERRKRIDRALLQDPDEFSIWYASGITGSCRRTINALKPIGKNIGNIEAAIIGFGVANIATYKYLKVLGGIYDNLISYPSAP